MIRSLWIAKTGLDAQQTQLDVHANNLANVNTSGFKRARAVFQDLLYQTVRQPGGQTSQQTNLSAGLQLGLGVRPVSTERIHLQGNLQQTGNSLDLAISGHGFFQVQMPDGTTAYTRDGSFQKDATGQLVTSGGYPLVPAINVPANAQTVTVGRDGTVSIQQTGSPAPVQVGQIQLANFVNPGGLQSTGENLYTETSASGPAIVGAPDANGMGSLSQGFVETSNVNVVEELVGMIQTQRAYEINSKAVQTSEQMLGRLSQL